MEGLNIGILFLKYGDPFFLLMQIIPYKSFLNSTRNLRRECLELGDLFLFIEWNEISRTQSNANKEPQNAKIAQ